ncbi:hypothetical protein ABQF04_15625 [Xanthomonas campestris pv. campestris]|uniref:hypothetical protein n=2 Tax=Xanthomonas TaxID=338 RepID=UPI00141B3474|nr:hypothetical protein [Xanthomonas arboricola]NIK30943.1 hypothetical protein [Xanthomonas arboricola]
MSEGKSDRMLQQPIEWLLGKYCQGEYSGYWANPSSLEDNSRELSKRMYQVGKYYPSDIAFIHRDTDTFTIADRTCEINAGVVEANYLTPYICIIPQRMTEAWFLFDQDAIRRAADKPRSTARLNLPNANEAQRRADPKSLLERALIDASELSGRKLDQFKSDISRRKMLVSTLISDYAPLRAHPSFNSFERELSALIAAQGW